MKTPVIALSVGPKGVVPHEHPALKGKEFTSVAEGVQAVVDYLAENPDDKAPKGALFVVVIDFK